ncbi:45148_t:CDS:2 [Gigaspora margarita]|uniref:45148_t:CDS:1 n=1 Tax=Gigaspora margarita TaxID=4874 RepID=A0ABM8W5X8_GIGMA|nr:45148_t:CDS:2 [Gigaspora margarita]
MNYRNFLLYWKFCEWAESKNNPIQQEGAETSSRYKSEIKEKKTTSFIKKDKNRTGRKTLELGNYTTIKSNNKNEEKSGHLKNESLNAILQEILNRLEKIESSYSSSRAIATSDTGRVHEKTQGTHSWSIGPTAPKVAKGIPKKKGLESANLKGKEKEHLMNDIGNLMKDRFMRINKAEGSRKMKTSEDYQVLKLEEKELYKLCKDIEKNYEIDTSCEQTQDTEKKRRDLKNIWKLL